MQKDSWSVAQSPKQDLRAMAGMSATPSLNRGQNIENPGGSEREPEMKGMAASRYPRWRASCTSVDFFRGTTNTRELQ